MRGINRLGSMLLLGLWITAPEACEITGFTSYILILVMLQSYDIPVQVIILPDGTILFRSIVTYTIEDFSRALRSIIKKGGRHGV